MSFIKIVVSLAMIMVMGIIIISLVNQYDSDMNANVTLISDSDYSSTLTQIKGNASNFRVSINSSSEGYTKSELAGGGENVQTGGFIKIIPQDIYQGGKVMINLVFLKLSGSDTDYGYVVNIFVTLLVFLLVAYGVKFWLGRSPD